MYLEKRGKNESVQPTEQATNDWLHLKTHMIPPTSFDSTRTYDLGQLVSRAPVLGSRETHAESGRGSFSAASQLLGKRWTLLIIARLLGGPFSFRGLLKQLRGISDRMLTYRLKELEREGIVLREVYSKSPVRVSYRLSSRGKALEPVIRAINEWSLLEWSLLQENSDGQYQQEEEQLEPEEAQTD